jgi:hypothetical protein
MNGRVYDPEIGRFIQADSVIQDSTDMQAFNRYTYVNNNPLSLTDPTGHFSWNPSDWWHDITHSFSHVWHSITHTIANIWHQNPLEWAMASTFREVGREFAKVPALQVVADAICAVTQQYWLIPIINGAIAASVTYASGGSFSQVLRNGAIAYTASAIVLEMGGQNVFGQGTPTLASTMGITSAKAMFASSMMVGGAIAKAQGGKFFDSKAFVEGMAISAAVSWMMTPTATTETNQGKVAGDSSGGSGGGSGGYQDVSLTTDEDSSANSVPVSKSSGEDIQSYAPAAVGTPYANVNSPYAGANGIIGVSMDCSGAVNNIYGEAGYPYSYQSTSTFAAAAQNGSIPFVQVTTPQAGDVVLWSSHMGIYATNAASGYNVWSAQSNVGFRAGQTNWFGSSPTYWRYQIPGTNM